VRRDQDPTHDSPPIGRFLAFQDLAIEPIGDFCPARTVAGFRQTAPTTGRSGVRSGANEAVILWPLGSGFGVDSPPATSLYKPHTARRPPLGAMSRLRSTSLIFGDQAFDRDRKREASTALRLAGEGTVMVPGCLTSESEERETWTAESLRAALLRRSTLTEELQGKVAGRDFGGLTFQVVHCFCAGGVRCMCAHEKSDGPRQTL
jgi:hypothetical protein